MTREPDAPRLGSYGKQRFHLEYPEGTMAEQILATARRYPENTAFSFMGKNTCYRRFASDVVATAKALIAAGAEKGDTVAICMPNCPQGVTMLYTANMIGAASAMIHPLSATEEIKTAITETGSRFCLTLDQFMDRFETIAENQ